MNITPETKIITSKFHHQFHLYKNFIIILSKDGGIKKLDKQSLNVVWEEKLEGQLLSYSFIKGNKLFASTTSTFFYSFNLDNEKVIENGTKNIFFSSNSMNDSLILANTKDFDVEGKKHKHFGVYDLDKEHFIFKRKGSTYGVYNLKMDRIIYSLPTNRNEIISCSVKDDMEWTIDLSKSFNNIILEDLRFIDTYKNKFIFHIKGNEKSIITFIDVLNGQVVDSIELANTDLKIPNRQSFIKNDILFTYSYDKVIKIDLNSKSITTTELDSFNISEYLHINDMIYFIDHSRKNIGEFEMENNKLNWIIQLSDKKNYKAWELFHKDGALYFNDSLDNLVNIKKAYNTV